MSESPDKYQVKMPPFGLCHRCKHDRVAHEQVPRRSDGKLVPGKCLKQDCDCSKYLNGSLVDALVNPTRPDYAEVCIKTTKKTVKQEDSLIRQIYYAGLSSATPDPINLGIIAPTSEGKTYPVIETLKQFPKDRVWKIGSMSTKVLVRQKGTLVNENGEPIAEEIKKLREEIDVQRKKKQDYEGKQKQLDELYENARWKIKLAGKILLFLEPPHHELWELLKTILSHDSYFIEHPYVDRTEFSGFTVKKIVTEGWPSCIFCSAKDESNWPVWPEIVTRFLITSPNMNQQKYSESNYLIAQRKGLPSLLEEELIVSSEELELAQEFTRKLLKDIESKFKDNDPEKPNAAVWIPYGTILSEALPANKGSDVRITKRLFSFLNIIPLTKSHLRQTLDYESETLTIATLDDLKEALSITQNLDGIPAYKLAFFKDYVYPLFESKQDVFSTRDLVDYYRKKTGKAITVNNMKQTYLNELQNAGYIDSKRSEADKREDVYWPIIEILQNKEDCNNQDAMDNYLRTARIALSRNYLGIPKDWLILSIQALTKYPFDRRIRLSDPNGNRIGINQFLESYEQKETLIGYFVNRHFCKGSKKQEGSQTKLEGN